jgi:uncharacterized LabA/DUF88 family protein
VLQNEHPQSRIDFSKLVQEMTGSDELLRAYYYNCLPFVGNPPTPEQQERFEKKRKFMDRLEHLPRFQVRLGKLALSGVDASGKPIYQQKRVDLMLGVDMTLLAAKGKITSLALFSGDSDTIPAVDAAKQEGVVVRLWHGSRTGYQAPSRDLYQKCDDRVELTADIISRILLEQ